MQFTRVIQKSVPISDADCTSTPFPGLRNPQNVYLGNGCDTKHIHELIYTARDPMVIGIGLAAMLYGAYF